MSLPVESGDTGRSGGSVVATDPATEAPSWPKCDAIGCWCHIGPRIVASTGAVYTVDELPRDGSGRVFSYRYAQRLA